MKFGNPEMMLASSMRSPESLHPLVEEAAVKAREIKAREAINPELFIGVYSKEAVQRELDYVRSMKEKFDPENAVHKQYADVFEVIFYQHAELSNWLGDNMHTILASEYDDIKNGMDVLIRLNDSERAFPYVGMGIDVTFGEGSIAKKIDDLFSEIKKPKDELGTIRYFMDPEYPQFKGEFSGVPHVVVGVERRHVVELARQWLHGENRTLAENPIQLVALEQIVAQLKVFRDYAKDIGKDDIADIYNSDISVFMPILRDKKKMDVSGYENDAVVQEIYRHLEMRRSKNFNIL